MAREFKTKGLSYSARIEDGKHLKVMMIQFMLYLFAAIALTVATGIYLWDKEVDNKCPAYNHKK